MDENCQAFTNKFIEIIKQVCSTKRSYNQTKALVISNNTNIPELNIRFNDESVQLVDNHKHLGVTFAADGNWTVHIENSYISIKTSKCSS
jgi:hypothetical protein